MNRVLCRDDTNRSHGQFKEVLDLPPPFRRSLGLRLQNVRLGELMSFIWQRARLLQGPSRCVSQRRPYPSPGEAGAYSIRSTTSRAE